MNKSNRLAFKRILDVLISFLLIIFLSPVMIITGLYVLLTMGSPVLYFQDRIGYQGQIFSIIKFRTMINKVSGQDALLTDQERLNKYGRFLRTTTLDELPELINILKGDMSLVGPRPLLVKYKELYSKKQWRRHEMPPGMAGPVIARGRNSLSWTSKFELDIWYVDNWSLRLDAMILFESILKVIKREGISLDGHATMPTFTGQDQDEKDE